MAKTKAERGEETNERMTKRTRLSIVTASIMAYMCPESACLTTFNSSKTSLKEEEEEGKDSKQCYLQECSPHSFSTQRLGWMRLPAPNQKGRARPEYKRLA